MNKLNKNLIITLIILLIIILIIAFYFFSQNKENNTNIDNISSNDSSNDDINFAKNILPYFGQYLANIYEIGDFNLETIPNEVALLLAWNNLGYNDYEYEDYSDTSDTHFKLNNNGGAIISITQDEMRDSINSLFGTNFKYEDSSFKDIGAYPSFIYSNTIGTISYKNGIYTANWTENGGGSNDSIYEKIDKLEKIENGYKVYVKTAYIHNDENTVIYSDCDFKNKKMINEVVTFDDIQDNEEIDNYIAEHNDSFSTYSYTMLYNESNNSYYLSEFKKV